MENRKDIGKAFREKLGELEKSPREGVWRSLDAELATRRKHAFITGWLRNIAITGVILLLLTIFTYPLWQDYMPHIYLVMPNEKKDTAPDLKGKNAAPGNTFTENGNPEGSGKATGVNATNDPAVTQANNPEGVTSSGTDSNNVNSNNSPYNTVLGNKESKRTSRSAIAGTNNNTKTANVTGALKSNKSESSGRAAIASTARKTTGKTEAGSRKQTGSGSNTTGNTETNARRADASNTFAGTSGGGTGTITRTDTNTTVSRKHINDPGKNSPQETAGSNNAGNTGNNNVADSNTVSATANEKNNAGNTTNNTNKSTDGKTVAGVEKNNINQTSTLINTDSLSIAGTGKTADSLAAAEFKPYKMDFAKVADSLRDLYGREEKTADKKKGDTIPYKKLYVYAFGAPMQFALPKTGGYLDDNLSEQSTSSKASFAYGAYLGYNITRKLSIRVGAIKTKGELVTNDVLLETTFIEHEPDEENPDGWVEVIPPVNFSGVEYNEGVTGSSIAEQLGENNNDFPSATVSIRNNFEFLEIPVELTYRLYDGSFGIGLFGGFVTRYTKENTVFAENTLGSIHLGKMKNLEEVNHAVSFGGSFHYNIMPNLQLNVEPVYKYYFNNNQFLRPHTYSIQFGLRYDFGFWNKKK